MAVIFPQWIKKNDLIEVIAPSDSAGNEIKKKRFENAKNNLKKRGYEILFGDNVFNESIKGRSDTAQKRAEEFMDAITNKDVKYIVSAGGGDFLCEILPYLDYNIIKENPKWFQGYSDNTGLTFSITTKTGIATVYGNNFGSYGMESWHKCVDENIRILEGHGVIQKSFNMYENEFHEEVTGLEGISNDKEVYYKGYRGGIEIEEMSIKGRLIGGCTDVISDLAGTPYEDYLGFVDKNKEDGIILYLESFNGNSEATFRILWKLREMGWFENVNGILIGRPMFEGSDYSISYEEAVKYILGPLGINYVFGCDIGHKQPQFTMVNGAIGEFKLKNHKGELNLIYT